MGCYMLIIKIAKKKAKKRFNHDGGVFDRRFAATKSGQLLSLGPEMSQVAAHTQAVNTVIRRISKEKSKDTDGPRVQIIAHLTEQPPLKTTPFWHCSSESRGA